MGLFSKAYELDATLDEKKNDPFFTNLETITGNVNLKTYSKTYIKSIKVVLSGVSSTFYSYFDNGFKTNFVEEHSILNKDFILFPVEDDKNYLYKLNPKNHSYELVPNTYQFPFKISLPGPNFNFNCVENNLHKPGYKPLIKSLNKDGISLPCYLPASYGYKLKNSYVKVEYSLQVYVENKKSELVLKKTIPFKFLPKPEFSHFSLKRINDKTMFEYQSFTFKYKVNAMNSSSNSNSGSNDNTPITTASTISSDNSKRSSMKLSATATFKNFIKSTISADDNKIQVPLIFQVEFISKERNLYNSNYNNRIIKTFENLKNCLKISLIAPLSSDDLLKLIDPNSKFANENNNSLKKGNLTENFNLSNFDIRLISNLTYYIKDTQKFVCEKLDLLNSNRLRNFQFKFSDFRKVIINNKLFYKYEFPPFLYDAVIENEIPSILTCNIIKNYQLQITGDLLSTVFSFNSRKIDIVTDVVLVNGAGDIYDNNYQYLNQFSR
ncbi:uncharacterized protein ASCRUDRAFT_75373 [Ascoidea rubescens DSM 1968]|uniref:Arrestin-like N-terminal domain-containing protein n=1 Tax=Ascoidea rubescens DSM 1968 TaxID=1344418 RepID=A0A1D2VI79_9ASCO|nr:hypothetical protein ASCRUDRAFT_75373 [Ascoidea rubescens DSM 1968]ODV61348.1 hypothetical protein ASCRUDRAFT_75373 [Ascoidea rubescens DSM 1968]